MSGTGRETLWRLGRGAFEFGWDDCRATPPDRPRHARKQEKIPDGTGHTMCPSTPNRLKRVPPHPPNAIGGSGDGAGDDGYGTGIE